MKILIVEDSEVVRRMIKNFIGAGPARALSSLRGDYFSCSVRRQGEICDSVDTRRL